MNNLEIIRRIDFLAKLDDDSLVAIARLFQEIECPKGTIIFKENEIGDCFYILKSGRVSLTKKLNLEGEASGKLIEFRPVDYFGELALIDEEPRSGTAEVIEDASLLKICKSDFLATCERHPLVLFDLVKTIARRLRETNDRYTKMLDELIKEKKLAAIGSAASKIVHDIKTPLTIIVLTAQLVEKVFTDTEKFTQRIVKQVNVLDDMVREILVFARGEKSDLQLTENDPELFFGELLDELNPIAEVREVHLSLTNRVSGNPIFDAMKIKRTLNNLCKNSMEALHGIEKGTVEILAETIDEKLHLRIRDNGPGIPEQIRDKLFQPFATFGKKKGTGLGLAICQKVIQDHNGEITVTNRESGGAQFDIYIPNNLEPTRLEEKRFF